MTVCSSRFRVVRSGRCWPRPGAARRVLALDEHPVLRLRLLSEGLFGDIFGHLGYLLGLKDERRRGHSLADTQQPEMFPQVSGT